MTIDNSIIDNLSDVEDLYYAAERVCSSWMKRDLDVAVRELQTKVAHFEERYINAGPGEILDIGVNANG